MALEKLSTAFYASAAAAGQIVEAVVKDKKRVPPCVDYLQGEYGIHDLSMGVSAVIGARGVERILELRLNASEFEGLQKSADAVKEQVAYFGGQTRPCTRLRQTFDPPLRSNMDNRNRCYHASYNGIGHPIRPHANMHETWQFGPMGRNL